MKKVKIKLTVLTLFFASLLMVSCGSETTENKEEDKVLTYDIEYETLEYKNGKFYKDKDLKDLFSGTAGTKNSDDKITRYATIKNGYLVNKKEWRDFGGELILTKDMEFKNGKKENGWTTVLLKEHGITITKECVVYKNGKIDKKESWEIESILETTSCKVEGEDFIEVLECIKSQNIKNFHYHFEE
jgi:sulfur carrier protein ThiS